MEWYGVQLRDNITSRLRLYVSLLDLANFDV